MRQDEDFNEQLAERYSTLRKDEKFNKLLANSSWMQVNIKPPTGGKCVPFFVDKKYTIDMLKSKIANKMPYPADQYRLLFGGIGLEGHRTLKDYGIIDGSVLVLTMGLSGGTQKTKKAEKMKKADKMKKLREKVDANPRNIDLIDTIIKQFNIRIDKFKEHCDDKTKGGVLTAFGNEVLTRDSDTIEVMIQALPVYGSDTDAKLAKVFDTVFYPQVDALDGLVSRIKGVKEGAVGLFMMLLGDTYYGESGEFRLQQVRDLLKTLKQQKIGVENHMTIVGQMSNMTIA